MSWTRYLLHDFWTAREFNRVDQERQASNRAGRRRSQQRSREVRDHKQRIEELEQDLGEATLLLRAMADLCVQKGVLTADELAARAQELDALDGVIDGRMTEPKMDDPSGTP